MIINWNNSESPVFITTTQAKEVLEVLEKHGLFDQHEWMTVGYGYNPEGEDVNWHSADTDVEVPEFWEETIFDLHYWGKEISYPFDWAHKVNQKQGIKRYLDEVKTVEAIKKGIDDFGGDLLYDLDYRITEGFLSYKNSVWVQERNEVLTIIGNPMWAEIGKLQWILPRLHHWKNKRWCRPDNGRSVPCVHAEA